MYTTLEKLQYYLLQLLWTSISLAQCSIFLEESDRRFWFKLVIRVAYLKFVFVFRIIWYVIMVILCPYADPDWFCCDANRYDSGETGGLLLICILFRNDHSFDGNVFVSLHMLHDAFQLLSANLCNLGYFHFYEVCSLVEIWSRKKRYQSNLCYFYAYIRNGIKFHQGVCITV